MFHFQAELASAAGANATLPPSTWARRLRCPPRSGDGGRRRPNALPPPQARRPPRYAAGDVGEGHRGASAWQPGLCQCLGPRPRCARGARRRGVPSGARLPLLGRRPIALALHREDWPCEDPAALAHREGRGPRAARPRRGRRRRRRDREAPLPRGGAGHRADGRLQGAGRAHHRAGGAASAVHQGDGAHAGPALAHRARFRHVARRRPGRSDWPRPCCASRTEKAAR